VTDTTLDMAIYSHGVYIARVTKHAQLPANLILGSASPLRIQSTADRHNEKYSSLFSIHQRKSILIYRFSRRSRSYLGRVDSSKQSSLKQFN
jgi:hypothetical protein